MAYIWVEVERGLIWGAIISLKGGDAGMESLAEDSKVIEIRSPSWEKAKAAARMCFAPYGAESVAALEAAITKSEEEMHEIIHRFDGCPDCGGDCGSWCQNS